MTTVLCLGGERREAKIVRRCTYGELSANALFYHDPVCLFIKIRSSKLPYNPGWGSYDVISGYERWSLNSDLVTELAVNIPFV